MTSDLAPPNHNLMQSIDAVKDKSFYSRLIQNILSSRSRDAISILVMTFVDLKKKEVDGN